MRACVHACMHEKLGSQVLRFAWFCLLRVGVGVNVGVGVCVGVCVVSWERGCV